MRRFDDADGTINIILDQPIEIKRWKNNHQKAAGVNQLLWDFCDIKCIKLIGKSTATSGQYRSANPKLKINVRIEV